MTTHLISVSRGGMYDRADGAQLALHLWLGPLGLHIFRRPFRVEPDFARGWRQ